MDQSMLAFRWIHALLVLGMLNACGAQNNSHLRNDWGVDPSKRAFTLCNDSVETVYLAISDESDEPVYTRGWESIASGECRNLSKFYYVSFGSQKQIAHWAQLHVRFKDNAFIPDEGLMQDGKYLCVPTQKSVDERGWEFEWDYWALAENDYSGRCPSGSAHQPSYAISWNDDGLGQFRARIKGKPQNSHHVEEQNDYGFPTNSLVPPEVQKLLSQDAYLFYKNRGYQDGQNPALKIRAELNKLPRDKLNRQQLQAIQALRAWCLALVHVLKSLSTLPAADQALELKPLDAIGESMPNLIQGLATGMSCTVLAVASGDASDLFEVVIGYSLCGEKLEWDDRLLSGLGLVVGSGALWRGMASGFEAASDVQRVASELRLLASDARRLGLSSPKDAEKLLELSGACPLKTSSLQPTWLEKVQPYINPFYMPEAFAASRCKVDEAIRKTLGKMNEWGFRNGDEALAFGNALKGIPGVNASNIMEIAGNARKAKLYSPDQLKLAAQGGARSYEQFWVFVKTGVAPNKALSTLLKADEAFAAEEILRRSSTKSDGLRVFGEDNLAKFFGIDRNSQKLPEGLIQRNDGMLDIFEVKNQSTVDIGNAMGTFRSFPALARKEGLVLGRMDLFVKTGFERFKDADYSVVNGLLHHKGTLVQVEGLDIHVIERALPKVDP